MAKCKICKDEFKQYKTTIVACSLECAIELGKQKPVKPNYKRANTQIKREAKDKLLTMSDYRKLLQREINQIVRIIDKDSVCISSQKKLNNKFDAGHRFSVGSHPHLRFNLHNIHAQSVHENQYKSGNPDGYDLGLKLIYGHSYYNFVHSLNTQDTPKLDMQDLIACIKKARSIKKDLMVSDMFFTSNVRIEIRNEINSKIGIYDTPIRKGNYFRGKKKT